MRRFYFPVLALGILLLLYSSAFPTGAYIDDNSLVFGNAFLKEARNPLQYWYRGQINTKAWPLTHTLYWLEYRAFHSHFWCYRFLLLLLHWSNGLLLLRFLRNKNAARLAAAVFWLHPIAVEAVIWITQLNVLLSTFFFAFWLHAIQQEGAVERKRSLPPLLGMLATKGHAYFLAPLVVLRNGPLLGWARSTLRELPALLFTGYAILLVDAGVQSDRREVEYSQTYLENQAYPRTAPPEETAWKEGLRMAREKITAAGRTGAHYFSRVFAPGDPSYVGVGDSWVYFLCGLLLLPLFLLAYWKRSWPALAMIACYLPVSGIFYAPFMKFSLVPDRAFYPSFFAFTWLLGQLHAKLENRWLRLAFWAWPLLLIPFTFLAIHQTRPVFSLP